jgi:hypothetical protein
VLDRRPFKLVDGLIIRKGNGRFEPIAAKSARLRRKSKCAGDQIPPRTRRMPAALDAPATSPRRSRRLWDQGAP